MGTNYGNSSQTILVTGGAGFIGSHLLERLLAEGHKIICLDNFDDFYQKEIKWANIQAARMNPNFTLVEGDIRDKECLKKLFSENRIERVVHLAARAGVRASIANPQLYEDVNIKGTLNLLEVCKEFPVEQFIFGSSSSVYGINSKVPFSEDDKIEMPISPYATSKRAGFQPVGDRGIVLLHLSSSLWNPDNMPAIFHLLWTQATP